MGIMVVVYLVMMAATVIGMVAAPIYLLWLAAGKARALARHHLDGADPVVELSERYVSGELTVEQLETSVAAALTSPRPRRRLSAFAGVATFDVCLALLVMLVAQSTLARAGGALLGFGALVGPVPRRVALYTFLAGLALLTAPAAALAFGVSAVYRTKRERAPA